MSFFGSPPSFAQGQALSATFHLNNLQRYAQGIRDAFCGIQTPFVGNVKTTPEDEYEAAIRHKKNSLYYEVEIETDNAFATLYIDETLTATFSGNGSYSGTIDMSAMAENQFYIVSIRDGSGGSVRMNILREYEIASLPTLASFADGTTPTAAQWQALSTYATTLSEVMLPPVAPMPQVIPHLWPPLFSGRISHRCRYLAYRWYQLKPFDGTYVSTRIKVNGNTIMHRRNGAATSDPTVDFAQSTNADAGWSGLVDLSVYAGSLAQGEEYVITVEEEDDGSYDSGFVRMDYLYESPSSVQTVSGWTSLENWAHGDYAWGSANPGPGTRTIGDIKSNLELIGSLLSTYLNPASVPYLYGAGKHFGPRSRRFLHYRNYAGETGKISWTYRGETQTVGLPSAEDDWLALDMDSLEGLWINTLYQLDGMRFAIEDNES